MAGALLFVLIVAIAIIGAFAERTMYVSPELSSYDDKIKVRNVFGNGQPTSVDTAGLVGAVQKPYGLVYDDREQFLYASDLTPGGVLRKIVAIEDVSEIDPARWGAVGNFNTTNSRFFMNVGTIFKGVNLNWPTYLQLSANGQFLYFSTILNYNIRRVPVAEEFNNALDSSKNIAGYPSLNAALPDLELCNLSPDFRFSNCHGGFGTYFTYPYSGTDCSTTTIFPPASGNCAVNAASTDEYDGIGSYSRFTDISGMKLHSQGLGTFAKDVAMFVTDKVNNAIRRIDLTAEPGLNTVTTWYRNVEKRNRGYATGPQLQAGGITIFGSDMFVGVSGAIWKFPSISYTDTTYGGSPELFVGRDPSVTGFQLGLVDGKGVSSVDGTGPRFYQITYLSHDDQGNLYASDVDVNNMNVKSDVYTFDNIRRITPEGNVTTIAGKVGCNHLTNAAPPNYDNGYWCFYKDWLMTTNQDKVTGEWHSGSTTQMNGPMAIAVTRVGNNIFFGDTVNNMVRQINCVDGYNLTFGLCVTSTFSPTHAPTVPVLCTPLSIVKTPAGNGCPTSCDGAEFKASMFRPFDVKLTNDQTKTVSVDHGTGAIRVMEVDTGVVTTVLEDLVLHGPTAVHIDDNDFIYIADLHRVLKIDPAALTDSYDPALHVTVLAGSGFPGDLDNYCIDAAVLAADGDSNSGSSAGTAKAGTAKTAAGTAKAATAKRALHDSAAGTAKTGTTVDATAKSAGSSKSSSDSGVSSFVPNCQFYTPLGVTTDSTYVYVTDSGNNAIRMILNTEPYNFYTIAVGDVLNVPWGITYNVKDSKLYVTSHNGHTVISFNPADYVLGESPIQLTTANIVAGSSIGQFGHTDDVTATNGLLMHPTGITSDSNGILYFNEWYMLPGEEDSEGSSKAGTAKGTAKEGSVVGTPKAGTVIAGTAKRSLLGTAKEGTAKAGTAKDGSSNTDGGSSNTDAGSSSSVVATSNIYSWQHESDIDYGHEPQYLHNVRKINVETWELSTIAGSHIAGLFEPDDSHGTARSNGLSFSHGASSKHHGSVGASKGLGATAKVGTAKSAGSLGAGSSADVDAAGTGKTAGSSGTGNSAGLSSKDKQGAGSSFLSNILGLTSEYIVGSISNTQSTEGAKTNGSSKASDGMSKYSAKASDGMSKNSAKGSDSGKSKSSNSEGSTIYADGFYSFNGNQCPVCPVRRALEEVYAPEEQMNLMTMGSKAGEDGSFNDGWAPYARFFKPGGITVTSNGDALWIADIGNNRLRNITCSTITVPTFYPTDAPTAVPTFPATDKPTRAPVAPKQKAGVKVPGKAPKSWKVKKVPGKLATVSVGGLDVDVNSFFQLPSTANVALIACGAIATAAFFVHFLFYRKNYMSALRW